MKNIGKIAVLAMTLALACALSACGGNASSSAASSAASSSAASASASSASASASASAASSSTAASSGASQDTYYSNEYFNLNYVLPEGWIFSTPEELSKINNTVAKITSDEAIDMVAVSGDGVTSVIVAITAPGQTTTGKTADQYLKEQTEELQKSLEGTYTYVTNEGDITFEGMTRTIPAAFTTITSGNKSIVLGEAIAEKNGYFLNVLATGTNEADVENAFKGFRATAE